MSRTIKKNYTKKELVTSPIHRKAGPMKEKRHYPTVCPDCMGLAIYTHDGETWMCNRCKDTGEIYE